MTRPKVFVTRRIPQNGIALLTEHCDVDIWDGDLPPSHDVLRARVQGMAGILCLLTDPIDAAVMDAAGESLQVISQYAVGYDNIDVATAQARGIAIGNTPGVLTDATADLTMALLLSATRQIVPAAQYVKDGQWQTWHPTLFLGKDLHQSTLGIIGFGRIGQAVARRALGFGMRVIANARRPIDFPDVEQVSLRELYQTSDVISVHTPLTPETHHLIDVAAFIQMKPDVLLINTARGSVIDQAALVDALRTGEIGAAALDVTDPEPIDPDDPLLKLPNVLVVPHIGSAGDATRAKMAQMAAQNLLAGLAGEPLPHPVMG